MLYRKRTLGTVAYLGGLPAVLEEFAWAWGQMVQFNAEYLADASKGEIVHYDRAKVSLHDYARNTLRNRMAGDWLIMLDTDHAPEPDLCARLVWHAQKYGLPVVSAIYRHKAGFGPPVAYDWDDSGAHALPLMDWDRDVSALRVGSAGAGSLLVTRAVFDRIDAELHEPPFARFENYGEDHAFFQRCKRLGIPVYLLPKVESPHLVVRPTTMEDFIAEQPGASTTRREAEGFV